MIKILYQFSQQSKSIELIRKITQLPPTYQNFKKLNITLDESLQIFDILETKKSSQSAKLINNLLTYVRKVHNRAILRSRQHLVEHIIKNMSETDLQMLPALMANITYTQNPELYISAACQIFIKQAPQMDIKQISNCAYSVAKIARRNIQRDLQTEKMIAYNAANLTLKNIIPIVQLKLNNCQDPQILMETLVAYQKMELFELHEDICQLLSKISYPSFGRVETQILHTLSKSDFESPAKVSVMRQLYDCLEEAAHQKRLTLQSMIIALHATCEQATKDLVEKCMDIYCEEYTTANIQDLGMMTNVLFKKGMMSARYSEILTESFESLRMNVDINIIMLLISNLSTMINLKLLDKKFINQFLISVKILNEKQKINRKFYEEFKNEMNCIENEEIKDKFQQIEHLIMK